MKEHSNAEYKDLILEALTRDVNPLRTATEIRENLLPNKTVEEIIYLLKDIEGGAFESPKFLFINNDAYLTEIGHSKGFYINGGFSRADNEYQKASSTVYNVTNNSVENKNINNDFSGSTIGQINQTSDKIDLKSTISQDAFDQKDVRAKKKSLVEILYWVIGIIVGLILLYEFIMKNIFTN